MWSSFFKIQNIMDVADLHAVIRTQILGCNQYSGTRMHQSIVRYIAVLVNTQMQGCDQYSSTRLESLSI